MQIPQTDRHSKTDAEQGFTIVETLVALFVFALAGVALITMQTQSTGALSRVETRALANLVAENNLIDAMASRTALELGVRSGEVEIAGRSWRWTLDIAATDDPTTLRLKSSVSNSIGEASDVSVTAYAVAGSA